MIQLVLNKNEKRVAALGAAVIGLMLFAPVAMAGADATFAAFNTKLEGWLTGSLGILIALVAFAIGIYNAVKQNGLMSIVLPFFLGLLISVGITVIKGGFTAII